MFTVIKRMEIAGSHCLNQLPYESKCKQVHGHNWIVTVHCRSKTLSHGMVVDFTNIKKMVHDKLDHKHLNDIVDHPTAERLAMWICGQIPECFKVEVQESEGNIAIYEK